MSRKDKIKTGADYKKHRKTILFKDQNGKCYYCKKNMLFTISIQFNKQPKNLATIEHIYHKFDEQRKKKGRWVLACYECNQKKGKEKEREFIYKKKNIVI